jgi:hypothetical protein
VFQRTLTHTQTERGRASRNRGGKNDTRTGSDVCLLLFSSCFFSSSSSSSSQTLGLPEFQTTAHPHPIPTDSTPQQNLSIVTEDHNTDSPTLLQKEPLHTYTHTHTPLQTANKHTIGVRVYVSLYSSEWRWFGRAPQLLRSLLLLLLLLLLQCTAAFSRPQATTKTHTHTPLAHNQQQHLWQKASIQPTCQHVDASLHPPGILQLCVLVTPHPPPFILHAPRTQARERDA